MWLFCRLLYARPAQVHLKWENAALGSLSSICDRPLHLFFILVASLRLSSIFSIVLSIGHLPQHLPSFFCRKKILLRAPEVLKRFVRRLMRNVVHFRRTKRCETFCFRWHTNCFQRPIRCRRSCHSNGNLSPHLLERFSGDRNPK